MSYPLPNPHLFLSPLPFTPVRDVRQDLWNYRILRSLQSNLTQGQLIHCPYYRPFSALDAGFTAPPFLIGADHYFEWRSILHHQPICVLLISIHPGYQFTIPEALITNSLIFTCPSITVLWWDTPEELPFKVLEFLEELDLALIHENLSNFIRDIQNFLQEVYRPISPYNNNYLPLRPTHPSALPLTPANPFTIPLVYEE